MEDIWKNIENVSAEKENVHIVAYPQNDYAVANSDEEAQEWDYGEEEGEEFKDINEYDPDAFGVSYAQLEQTSYGDPELGMSLGGKFAKFEKIVQSQAISKEKLYLNKLKAELNTY